MTFKLAPNEFGADMADRNPYLDTLEEFAGRLIASDANGTGKADLTLTLDANAWRALRVHSQRPYKPMPREFVTFLCAGKVRVTFKQAETSTFNATQPPAQGETTVVR